jgi:hypothetical protein
LDFALPTVLPRRDNKYRWNIFNKESSMKVYLHSERAEQSDEYPVRVSPAADREFVSKECVEANKDWEHADGTPRQYEIKFCKGYAEVEDSVGKYLIARGIAHAGVLRRPFFITSGERQKLVVGPEGNIIIAS